MVKIRRAILSVAIAIIFVMFVAYAIQSFYPSPKYNDFCSEDLRFKAYNTEKECVAIGGRWTEYDSEIQVAKPINDEKINGWCETDYECREEYDSARDFYNRNVFFIATFIGLVTIILSLVFVVEAVSAGFMGGGVLLVIYGTIRYWGEMSDIYRTIMLAVALAVLIWIGYKKLK